MRLFEALRRDQNKGDCTLLVGKNEIPMHKIVLQSRSVTYRSMFGTVRNTGTRFKDISRLSLGAVNAVIHFMYTGTLPPHLHADPEKLTREGVEDRMRVLRELEGCDYYQLTDLESFKIKRNQAYRKYSDALMRRWPDEPLVSDFRQFYKAGQFTDGAIEVNGKKIRFHEDILMEALDLDGEGLKKALKILEQTDNPDHVGRFIGDIYSGEVPKNPESMNIFNAITKGTKSGMERPFFPVEILWNLQEDEEGKDFAVIVGKTHIRVHRRVLEMRSCLCRDMFDKVRSDKSRQVNDYTKKSARAIREVIHYMYTGRLSPYVRSDPKTLAMDERKKRGRVLAEVAYVGEFYQLSDLEKFNNQLKSMQKKYSEK